MALAQTTRLVSAGQVSPTRELVFTLARKGTRVRGGFTPHTQAMQDLVVSGELTPFACFLWQVLFDLWNEPRNRDNPHWFPTQRVLRAMTGRAHETIIGSMQLLEQAGLLDRGSRSGSSSWVGATLQLPDYEPRLPSSPATPGIEESEHRDSVSDTAGGRFFGATMRSEKPISSDRENRSETRIYHLTPNKPNPQPLNPTTTPPVVVADTGKYESSPDHGRPEPKIKQRRSGRLHNNFAASSPAPEPHHQQLLVRLLAFGVSPQGAQQAIMGLKAHDLVDVEHLERLMTYAAVAPNVKHPAGLLVALCGTGFRPPSPPSSALASTGTLCLEPPVAILPDGTRLWEKLLLQLRGRMNGTSFDTWIAPTRLLRYDDPRIVIGTPNVFVRDEIEQRYRMLLTELLTAELGRQVDLVIVIDLSPGT